MRKLRNGKLPKLTKAATLRPRIQTLAVGFPRLDSSYYSVLPEFKLGEKKKKLQIHEKPNSEDSNPRAQNTQEFDMKLMKVS